MPDKNTINMVNTWLYSIISVIIVSLISLISIFGLSIKDGKLKSILLYMVSFSTGALFADVFFHLMPEILEESDFSFKISSLIIFGIIFSFIVEKFVQWRHCHRSNSVEHVHSFAVMNLFGDAVHNLIDGLIIGVSYLAATPTGIATTIAVILHEIPQEIGDFSVLLHGGFSKKKAIILNFVTALTALGGCLFSLALSKYIPHVTEILLPFAAGNFIYIAGSDLIPELHKETKPLKSSVQLIMFILGCIALASLLLLE